MCIFHHFKYWGCFFIVVIASPTTSCVPPSSGTTTCKLPSVSYVGSGYDLVKGNPNQDHGLVGIKQSILSFEYDGQHATPDGRYLLPQGVVAHHSTSCAWGVSFHKFFGAQEYARTLSVRAGVSGGDLFAKFSASSDYQEVKTATVHEGGVSLSTSAECSVYTAYVQSYDQLPLSSNFKNAVKDLPVYSVPSKEYFSVIDTFGTHYVAGM